MRPNFSNNGHHQHHQQHFLPNQASSTSFQNQPTKKILSELEKSMENFLKTDTAFMQNTKQMLNNHAQAIFRLEVQISQLASSLSERPKGTLPSQSLTNPKNSSQIFEAQINQCNDVHTLSYEKKVDTKFHSQQLQPHPVLLLPLHLLALVHVTQTRTTQLKKSIS